jgi:hypothetical protein
MQESSAIGPIDWGVDPHLTERALAVMLLQHSAGWQRQPSQGDAGVDVVRPFADGYEVIQIKSHTSALTGSQKAKVERSFRQVLDDPKLDRPVRAWRLLMPVNPTHQAEEWFQTFTAKAAFECEWWGRHRVEGLAADEAHVVDWYFRDGKARLESRLRDLHRAASILDNADAPLRAGEVGPSLETLFNAINRDDPHYRYFFEISGDLPPLAAEKDKPGIVLACSRPVASGGYLTVRVVAKHHHATEWCPVPISFALDLPPDDDELSRQVEDAFGFGTDLTLPSDVVRDLYFGAPGGLEHHASEGILRIVGLDDEPFVPYRLRLRVTAADGHVLAETVVEAQRRTRGHRGVEVHFAELGGAFSVVFRFDLTTPGPQLRIRGLNVFAAGSHVERVHTGYSLLNALRSPNRLTVLTEHGERELTVRDLDNDDAPIDTGYMHVLDNLHEIQQHTYVPLIAPEAVTVQDQLQLRQLVRLLAGGTDCGAWDEYTLPYPAADLDRWIDEISSAGGLAIEQPLHLHLGDQLVDLGQRYTLKLYSVRILEVDDLRRRAATAPDEQILVHLTPDKNDHYEAVPGVLQLTEV